MLSYTEYLSQITVHIDFVLMVTGMRALLALLLTLLASQGALGRGAQEGVQPVPRTAQRLAFAGKPRWHLPSIFISRTIAIECAKEVRAHRGAVETTTRLSHSLHLQAFPARVCQNAN